MNTAALIRLCNESGAQLPPLPDGYVDAEWNLVKKINAQTEYQIPGMNGAPNENAALLPFPTALRLLSGADSGVVNFPTGSTTVTISTNLPGSFSQALWRLLDNDLTTKTQYNGNFGTVPFITIDFGRLEMLSQFGMTASDQSGELIHAPTAFQLEVSENGSSYTNSDFYTPSGWTTGERKTFSFAPVSCRYVRVGLFGSASFSAAIIAGFDFS